jgi:hypothetical protein
MFGLIVLWIYFYFDISSEQFWFQINLVWTQHLFIYFDRLEFHSLAIAPIIIDTGCTQSIVYGPQLGNIAVYGSV